MSYLSSFVGWFSNAFQDRKGVQHTGPLTASVRDIPATSSNPDVALQVAAVYACVDLLAKTLASMPVRVYKKSPTGRDLVEGDRISTLLSIQPNRRHTPFQFWRLMGWGYFLKGNAYALKRYSSKQVSSLVPLLSGQMQVEELPNGRVIYKYTKDGKETVYQENQILHLRGPGNSLVGMSRLEYMRGTVNVAVEADNHASRIYRQKGRRPGFLTVDRVLNNKQREAIKSSFADIASGEESLSVLEAGIQYVPFGLSPADLQLLETKRFTVEEVCRWFGVPPILVNDSSKASTLGSSTGQVIEAFHKLTVGPEAREIEQSLERALFTLDERWKYDLEFDMDSLLRASLKERMEIYSKGVQNGIYVRNDIRKKEGLPAVEGADILTVQSNLIPIKLVGKIKPTQEPKTPNSEDEDDGKDNPIEQ